MDIAIKYIRLSSANRRILDVMSLPISLIYKRNIKVSSTVPCGTPDVTLAVLDLSPSMVTCCSRCVSHASSHDRMFSFMPYDS